MESLDCGTIIQNVMPCNAIKGILIEDCQNSSTVYFIITPDNSLNVKYTATCAFCDKFKSLLGATMLRRQDWTFEKIKCVAKWFAYTVGVFFAKFKLETKVNGMLRELHSTFPAIKEPIGKSPYNSPIATQASCKQGGVRYFVNPNLIKLALNWHRQ